MVIMYTVKPRSNFRDSQGKIIGLLVVMLAVLFLLILSSYHGIGNLQWSAMVYNGDSRDSESDGYFYGIMFDAGSTGSRIHAFKFKEGKPGQQFEFVEELFEQIKPGLSSFASDPQKGADSLVSLLDKAKHYIPQQYWKTTPMALKATAGLRLLPGNQSQALLDAVKKLFGIYPFELAEDGVAIMDGLSEGIYIWVAFNFFKGDLDKPSATSGVMDLGGGSTQVTFTPKDQATIDAAPLGFINKKVILGKETLVYSHSYLNLGLMSGRIRTVGGTDEEKNEDGINPDSFDTVCFGKDISTKFQFGGKEYIIRGTDVTGDRFEACYKATKGVVGNSIQKPPELKKTPFVVVSYYYDTAVDSKLIEPVDLAALTVGDYLNAAKKVCANPPNDLPFLCLDLTYVSTLLIDGFGFGPDKTIEVGKKVAGQEISWALGAMFDILKPAAS